MFVVAVVVRDKKRHCRTAAPPKERQEEEDTVAPRRHSGALASSAPARKRRWMRTRFPMPFAVAAVAAVGSSACGPAKTSACETNRGESVFDIDE